MLAILKTMIARLFTVHSGHGVTDAHDMLRGVLLSALSAILTGVVQALPAWAGANPMLLALVPALTYFLNDLISRLPGTKTLPNPLAPPNQG